MKDAVMRRYKVTFRRRLCSPSGLIESGVIALETSKEITSSRAIEDVLGKSERRLDARVWSIEVLEICSERYREIRDRDRVFEADWCHKS